MPVPGIGEPGEGGLRLQNWQRNGAAAAHRADPGTRGGESETRSCRNLFPQPMDQRRKRGAQEGLEREEGFLTVEGTAGLPPRGPHLDSW